MPEFLDIIAGLGNPGAQYVGSRHNAGFEAVEELARRSGLDWKEEKRFQCLAARGSHFTLLKPMTFMNRSGNSIAAWSRFFKIPADRILVIYDDTALPPGRLRLRPGGSAAGHNGMQNIIDALATEAIPRLRIGIGGNTKADDLTGHVLGRYTPDEAPVMRAAIERAAEAAEAAARDGLEIAMNLYNKSAT